MRRYYTNPPTARPDVPEYVYERYAIAGHIQQLIQWSIREYQMGFRYLSKHASARTIKFFMENYSAMRVLAESDGFIELIRMLNEENYNKLTGRERVFLRRAYEMYKSLS